MLSEKHAFEPKCVDTGLVLESQGTSIAEAWNIGQMSHYVVVYKQMYEDAMPEKKSRLYMRKKTPECKPIP